MPTIPDINATADGTAEEELVPIQVRQSDMLRHGPIYIVALPDRMQIPGMYGVSMSNRSEKPRGKLSSGEQRALALQRRLAAVPGIAEVRAEGYELRIEFGRVFEPDAIMPEVLSTIISMMEYKRVHLSFWIRSVRLWMDQIRIVPEYAATLSIPGVEIQVEPAEDPSSEHPPAQWITLIIEQGGGTCQVPARPRDEELRMFMDPALDLPVVVGMYRPAPPANPDGLIIQSIGEAVETAAD